MMLPLISLALLWLVAVVTPGPNFFAVAQTAARHSWRRGVATASGVASGTVVWALAGGLGIRSLFAIAPFLYMALKVAGGCYLIYLGSRLLWRSRLAVEGQGSVVAARPTVLSAYRLGLLSNLTNPKTALFVASIFAAVIPSAPSPGLLIGAAATMADISFSWYALVALLLGGAGAAAVYARCRRWLDAFAGACYLFFGLRLVMVR